LGWYQVFTDDLMILSDFVWKAAILPLTPAVVDRTILIRQSHRVKTPDAVITATALEYGLTFLKRNLADFKKISALIVLNPFNL
jgi:predicted nucleic acid-binding protein